MKKSGVFFLIVVFSLSCEKEVEIDIPLHEQKIVANSIFSGDTIIILNLSHSVGMFENPYTQINNADVKLFENNIFIETLNEYESGNYASKLIPEVGKKYRFEICANNYGCISCSDSLPPLPVATATHFVDSAYLWGDDVSVMAISQVFLTIFDPPAVRNFYEVELKLDYTNPITNMNTTSKAGYIKNADFVLQNENIFEYYPSTIVFSDDLFNGKEYNMTIDFFGPMYKKNGIGVGYDFNLIVNIRSVSYNYYLYKKTLFKHLHNQTGDIWNDGGSPAQMFSNIVGGYGIFASYSQISDTLINENINHNITNSK